MKINVMDNWAVIVEDDTLQQNAAKNYEVKFNFDKSWDGYSKTIIFEAGPANVVVVLDEDRCLVPKECLKYGGVKLKIGIYGIKGEEHKAIVGYLTSMIVSDRGLNAGSSSPGTTIPDDVYSEIMAAIGDLTAAGFKGKTLAEILREIKDSVCDCDCETAADEEVGKMLSDTFGSTTTPPKDPDAGCFDNTATNKEVEDILDDVFGKKP